MFVKVLVIFLDSSLIFFLDKYCLLHAVMALCNYFLINSIVLFLLNFIYTPWMSVLDRFFSILTKPPSGFL
ncbi:hypothetical protein AAJ76_2220003306 [Vairimorpha ceranae]|uniref:Uncharacterized protein n=1 Tax=Vairimorpha ceranae TaxID=40302 RepID=A0A0F9W7Q2_9MICR|nr:hypothetical protein AAJ76_2220003306 [Vairimorpha ceranae]KKO73811.1 hypothetical protein AAJ76_2220003306 [Vairimorpha ceranae]